MTVLGTVLGLTAWALAYLALGWAAEKNFMVLWALFLGLCLVG